MKTNQIVLTMGAIIILLSSFCNIPIISDVFFRIFILLYVVFSEKISSYIWEKRIQEYKTDIVVEGINIYIVPYKYMKSHNVLVFKGKNYNIVIEEEILNNLNEEQLKAVCYHEVGHTHTWNKELIMNMSLVSLFFNSIGLHEAIYKGEGEIYLLVGISLFLITEFLKRHIEYRADRYAEKCGIDRKMLKSAVKRIEEMNDGKKIIISSHPSIEQRFKSR